MYNNNRQKEKTAVQKHCPLCIGKIEVVDYKDSIFLRKFTSSYGKIAPKKRSGACSKHQRMLSEGIKRARIMALLPFAVK